MAERYPIPSHAASFWIAGDDLWIAFPGQGPEERGHSIRMPASAAGMAAAVQIMRDRAAAQSLKIGNRGTPTQYEIEAGKAWGKVTKRHREEAEAQIAAKVEEKAAIERRKAQAREAARQELEELGL